jgi:hypothetical protein
MANQHSISEFIDGFNGGLRPNRFYISIGPVAGVNPPQVNAGDPASQVAQGNFQALNPITAASNRLAGNAGAWIYHVRSASLPASTLTTIPVPYRGRVFKMPGVRTYGTWEMSVLDDKKHGGYKFFSEWSNKINGHLDNSTSGQALDMTDLMTDITVFQLGLNGNDVVKTSVLKRAWCSNVGQISFDMENNENIITFSVQIEFSEMDYAYNG